MTRGPVRLLSRYHDMLPFPEEDEAQALLGHYGITCVLAGIFIDTFLFGVFTVQFITYVYAKAPDKAWVRGIVGAVAGMACLLTGYNWYFSSYIFVYGFGVHTTFFETSHLGWLPLIDAVTMSLTQLFFAHRAYRLLNRNIWVPVVVVICMLISVSACIATLVVFSRLNSQLDSSRVLGSTVIWMAATMVGDTVITGSILWGLTHTRTAVRQTQMVITRLTRMTLEAQAPASVVALTLLVEVIVHPANMLGTCIILFQSKIYVVGFFYSLNARQRLVQTHQSVTMGDMEGVDSVAFNERRAATIVVNQETEMHVMHTATPHVGLNRKPFGGEHLESHGSHESKASVTVIDENSSDYRDSPKAAAGITHAESVV